MQDHRLNCSMSCCETICGLNESSADLGIPPEEGCGKSFGDSRADELLSKSAGSSSSGGSSSSSISSNRACRDILSLCTLGTREGCGFGSNFQGAARPVGGTLLNKALAN